MFNEKEEINNKIEKACNCNIEEKKIELIEDNNKKKIDELELALEKSNQSLLYLKADLENIKRNTYKEIDFAINKSSEKIILNFLNVLDDFELCIESEKKLNKDLPEGFNLIYKSFLKTLEQLNIKEVDTKGNFDSSIHETISFVSAEEMNLEKDKIFSVVKKGYFFKNNLIRAAQVIIVS